MKKQISYAFCIVAIFFCCDVFATVTWQKATRGTVDITHQPKATGYEIFKTDENALKASLFAAANESILSVPMANGTVRNFVIRETPILQGGLAVRYAGIKTFTGTAVNNPAVIIKIDYTVYGFHAMVFGEDGISFADPADDTHSGYYTVHYKKDERQQEREISVCATIGMEPATKDKPVDPSPWAYRLTNGNQLRTYTIALSCSHQYAEAATGTASPTIAQVLSKMTTTINRVNGVYEKELSVSMVFTPNEDTLIWTAEVSAINGPDPFSTLNSLPDPNPCLTKNQEICDARIGNANYDIGHVFTTGAGGLSDIGVVCMTLRKAHSVTGRANPTGDGFDIDYVAHEIGHEFGANHTFNNGYDGSCGGSNRYGPTAYEPGSGSTIMAYAGICSPDDIQPNSDDYFHAISIREMHDFIISWADGCATKTATGNKTAGLPPYTTSYAIPSRTPFELTGPTATDSVTSTAITYCWEQWNIAGADDAGQRLTDVQKTGPLFRSYPPSASPVRVFPKESMVLAGKLSDAGKEKAQGEKIPESARYLTFKLTVRNMLNGKGCILVPDDTIHLDVINTGEGFKVTSQDDSTAVYFGGSLQEVKWNVAGTNAGTINTASVDIYMSEDGGYTWPHYIGNFPNSGSAIVPLGNPDSATNRARIKVKGGGNVFFNVNKYDFSVVHSDGTDTVITISPIPTHTNLRVSAGNKGPLKIQIFDMTGKEMLATNISGLADIPVQGWPRGMYIIRIYDSKNAKTIMKFVVE